MDSTPRATTNSRIRIVQTAFPARHGNTIVERIVCRHRSQATYNPFMERSDLLNLLLHLVYVLCKLKFTNETEFNKRKGMKRALEEFASLCHQVSYSSDADELV